ncbi:MAG TPA: DMT family transporter [Pseudonocardia sp.]|nr:DMT family transporter [Pseudonocardia sp.]
MSVSDPSFTVSTTSSITSSTTSGPVGARRRGAGVPLLALAGVLWGTGGLIGSLLAGVADLSPLAVAAYRLGLGGLLVAAVVATTGGTLPRGRAAWRRVGAVAVLAALFQACYFTAVTLTSVGLATLVTIGTSPVVVLAVEAARGRAPRGTAVTVGLALLGLGLLIGLPAESLDPVATLVGSAFAVLSGAGFAAITLLAAKPVDGLDDATSTAAAFVIGGSLLAAVAAVTTGLDFRPGIASFGLLLALAAVPTALAYTAYFRGLRAAAGPGVGAVLALLEPLTGAVLAAVVLGERLGAAGIAGAALLGAAVVRAARS